MLIFMLNPGQFMGNPGNFAASPGLGIASPGSVWKITVKNIRDKACRARAHQWQHGAAHEDSRLHVLEPFGRRLIRHSHAPA